MKACKIKSLKKNVLLVDGLPDDAKNFRMYGKNLHYDCMVAPEPFDIPEGNWKLLGKLKDLTEEQCEPLVKSLPAIFNPELKDYKNYNLKNKLASMHYNLETTKESFLSALEASGLYLNGNPFYKEIYDFKDESEMLDYMIWYEEAKQNVFSAETLVFVEQ